METLNAIIEKGEDGYYAYVKQMDGCVAGGETYAEYHIIDYIME